MVRVKKISQNELPKLIEISYQNDQELFDKFHLQPMPFTACVQTTFLMITDMAAHSKCDFYKVIYQKEPIGFIVTRGDILYSFGISMKFRKKNILIDWWQVIKQLLGKRFMCILYKNNTRAISFLEKQGMIIADEDAQHNSVTLINQN